jgi:hypothetical protein
MHRKLKILLLLAIFSLAVVFALNYLMLQRPLTKIIDSDYRNTGIDISAHYGNYVSPSILVINVNQIDLDKAPMDVFRVFLQFAEKLRDKDFESVELSSKGVLKFTLKGRYFSQLGAQYSSQNPVYTIRTFPENVYKPDGKKAFSSWSGGLIGVVGKQMQDFSEFSEEWYINDMFN